MIVEERKQKLMTLGAVVAKELPGFYGNVQFNIQNGVLTGGNINEGFRPDKRENESKNAKL